MQCLRVDAPAPSLENIKDFPDLDLHSSLCHSIQPCRLDLSSCSSRESSFRTMSKGGAARY
jgi:hypothetical protein